MLNINELEQNWRIYKIKSYIPYAIITISVIIIATVVYYVTSTQETPIQLIAEDKNSPIYKNTSTIPIVQKQNNTEVFKGIEVQHTSNQDAKNKSVVLSPSLSFMSNLKHSNVYNEDEINPTYKDNVFVDVKSKKVEAIEEEAEDEVVQKPTVLKKSSIKIDRKNSKNDLDYVIKRFKKTNNPALSLFIAKKYYSLGEYHKSYNYALITNELNDKIDASWIIFIKSLVKLNEKDEAIKTLTKYINHSHSNQAKILLDEIKSGDFK